MKDKKAEKKNKKENGKKQKKKPWSAAAFFRTALLMIAGIALEVVGVCFFFSPSGLTPGGLSGIAISVERFGFLPFGKGIIVLILNIPIIVLGICKFGWRFFGATIVALVSSSGLMEIVDRFVLPDNYAIAPLPAAIGGGVLIGVAVGLIMRAGATFGGTDILVKVLHLRFKYMQTGSFYLFVDGAIVAFGTVCSMLARGGLRFENFDPEILIYSVVAIFIQSYFANLLLYGTQGARMIYIITTKERAISDRITKELHSGVTYLQGKGAYTDGDRQVLLCAMRRQNLPGAKEIVLEEDPQAFMIVMDANEVMGRGFTLPGVKVEKMLRERDKKEKARREQIGE